MRIWLVLIALWMPGAAAIAAWPPPPPTEIVLSAQEHSGVAAPVVLARGGVPLARVQDVRDLSRLQLVDAQGTPVPAQFRALARWNAARDSSAAALQWLQIDAPVVPGALYRLRTDAAPGGNPPPATPLTLTLAAGRYTVDTGVARFVLDPSDGSALSEIRRADGTLLATGLPLQVSIGAQTYTPAMVRLARIDDQGPLSATLTVEWTLTMPATGGGGLALRRQYRFEAGSSTVHLRSALAWEGSLCGTDALSCEAGVNGLLAGRVRDRWQPVSAAARSVHAYADNDLPIDSVLLPVGANASLRQLRRSDRLQPLAYTLDLPGVQRQGGEADGGVLALGLSALGGIGIGLARMDHHEPQQLAVIGSELVIDWVDQPGVWIGNRQAVYATAAIAVLPAAPVQADIERALYAPLSSPPRLWAAPAQFAASEAVPEFPLGPLPTAYASYDGIVDLTLQRTVDRVDNRGIRGLMTSGLWPSYWGDNNGDQIDCGVDADPTPADDWDDPYWCGVWTDYHNASMVATLASFRAGDSSRFEQIAVPAALRMLHTQILQCAPDDPYFYCGQAPAGGGGYRFNFNSSHGYLEGVIHYYFLTGDPWVLDTLQRGAASMRAYLCPGRGNQPLAPMCAATQEGGDNWLQLNDRAASQWYEVFRFLGQTVDASYLDDWRGNIARWTSLFWAQGSTPQGDRLGLIVASGIGQGLSILAPGAYTTSQLWMASGYDFEQLARLRVVMQDAPIGLPAQTPGLIISDWARALRLIGASAPGNGSAAGIWPNAVDFSWSGSRIGGSITGLAPFWSPGAMPDPCLDACLYDTGKGFMTATLARGADFSGDPALRELADDFVRRDLQAAANEDLPLGKIMAEYLIRLPSAIARLTTSENAELFASGFE